MSAVKLPKDMVEVQESKMKRWKYIMQSMTKEEKQDPDVIDSSRLQRIAKGSGTKPEEVQGAHQELQTRQRKWSRKCRAAEAKHSSAVRWPGL